MTPEQEKKLNDIHEFLFGRVPGLPSSPTRAEQMEELLKAYRAGSFLVRILLWGAGAVTAVGAAVLMFKDKL